MESENAMVDSQYIVPGSYPETLQPVSINYIYLQFNIILFPYLSPNIVRVIKSEKNEMGWACGAYG